MMPREMRPILCHRPGARQTWLLEMRPHLAGGAAKTLTLRHIPAALQTPPKLFRMAENLVSLPASITPIRPECNSVGSLPVEEG